MSADDVRARMGYAPLPNPLFIQGGIPDTGPEEDEIMQRIAADAAREDAGEGVAAREHGQVPAKSPLVPRAVPDVMPPPTVTIPVSELIVSGNEAIYRGQVYQLDHQAQQEISIAVLRSAKRQADAGLAELQEMPKGQTTEIQAAGKKRGRPPGSKNKKTLAREAEENKSNQ